MIRVLIADDEAMIRSALAALLRLEPDLEVVAECADGAEALREAARLKPDVCLLDVEMPGSTAWRSPSACVAPSPRGASW